MDKFSEQSKGIQWGTIATIIGILFSGFGAALVWAGDAFIDQKYASDADVKAVQEQVVNQVEAIKQTVEQNTKTVRATAASVDGLTLVVLDLRIRDLEADRYEMESEKQNAGGNWTGGDERDLNSILKALSDLSVQRDRLFDRILQNSQ